MLFIVTDSIEGKQYKTDDYNKACEQLEKCVIGAIHKGHELTKSDIGYTNQHGDFISKNWNDKVMSPLEEDEELSSAFTCQLCGDAISEDFGFCVKCKKVI